MKTKIFLVLFLLSITTILYSQNNVWNDIISFVERGLEGVDITEASISDLENKINELYAVNSDQARLLQEARDMIESLKLDIASARYSVEVALERMTDAEDVAAYFIAESEQKILELQGFENTYKNSWIGGSILSIGWGASGAWAASSLQNGRFDPWSISPTIISSLIYIGGHYIFKLW